MKEELKILIVEDQEADAELMKKELENKRFQFISKVVIAEGDFQQALKEFKPDVILSDYSLPQFNGMDALKIALKSAPLIPFIVVTGTLSEEIAVDCIKTGAWDYVLKDHLVRLSSAVKNALKLKHEKLERIEADKALKISEEKYRNLVENISDVIFTLDVSRVINYVSPAMEPLSGYSVAEVTGKPFTEFIHPEDLPGLMVSYQKAIAGKAKINEYRIRNRSGKYIWVRSSSKPIYDGKIIIGLRGIITDISQRKQAEERYRKLFENKGTATGIFGDDKVITMCNSKFEELSGYSRNEIEKHMKWTDFVTEEYPNKMKKYHEQRTKKNGLPPTEYECDIINKNGKLKHVSVNIGIIPDSNVRIVSLIDITARVQAENALRKSEKKFRDLAELLPEVVCETDIEGNLTFTSQRGYELLGYTKEDLTKGLNVLQLVAPEDKKNATENWLRIIKGEKLGSNEYMIVKKDGVSLPAMIHMNLITEHGKPVGMRGIVIDITDIKLYEKKIQKELGEKEVLLKEIHHRVKNNLQVICSLLMLQSRYIKDEKALDMFQESQDRVRAMALVHEKLYKSENISTINFAEYVKSLINTIYHSHHINPAKIHLKFQVESLALSIQKAVPCGLIINEIISNSFKHAFPKTHKGEIKIGLTTKGKENVLLTLSDNGVGLPPDFDVEKADSLGMRLIYVLGKEQLGGDFKIDSKNGTEYQIIFKKF